MGYPTFVPHTPLQDQARETHADQVARGFWPDGGNWRDRNFGEAMALVTSELSEALDEHRSGKPLYYTGEGGKPEGVAVEVSDAMIRGFDMLGAMADELLADHGLTIDDLFRAKAAFNRTRGDRHGRAY